MEGTFSRRFAGLAEPGRSRVKAQLGDLTGIEIVGAKELVPVMSALAAVAHVNMFTADAVASALVLDSPILVATRSTLLDAAAAVAGVPISVISHG